MKDQGKKTAKQTVHKLVALFMAIMYLVHPLHDQIGKGLHTLSHSIQTTGGVLSHSNSTISSKEHRVHDHRTSKVNHQHQLLDFMTTFLDAASGSSDSERKSMVKNNNLDKHLLTTSDVKQKRSISVDLDPSFPERPQSTLKGCSDPIYPPPQSA